MRTELILCFTTAESGVKIYPVIGCCLFLGGGSVVIYPLFVVISVVCFGFSVRSLFCFADLCGVFFLVLQSSRLGKGELVALLLLCSECHAMSLTLLSSFDSYSRYHWFVCNK